MVLCTAARRGDLVALGAGNIKDGWISWKQEKAPHLEVEMPLIDMLASELARHAPHGDNFLGVGPDKRQRSKKSFGGDFAKWRRDAGLPEGLSLHGVRKGIASILSDFGVSNASIDVLLGHEIGSSATKVYVQGAERKRIALDLSQDWQNVSW